MKNIIRQSEYSYKRLDSGETDVDKKESADKKVRDDPCKGHNHNNFLDLCFDSDPECEYVKHSNQSNESNQYNITSYVVPPQKYNYDRNQKLPNHDQYFTPDHKSAWAQDESDHPKGSSGSSFRTD
jgi:hypothetical protein